VDYLAILEDHLGFIERFYNAAAEPFETTLRKIGEGEEPFVQTCAPEDYDGPEYLAEGMEADKCIGVVGNCSLGLLEKALHDYLREFIMREAEVAKSEVLSPILNQYKGNGWFARYCDFLKTKTEFEWSRSPVAFERIEQINLSRNDIYHHDEMIDTTQPRQSHKHFEKYPVSRFAPEWEIEAFSGQEDKPQFPLTIAVTREKLSAAIVDVRQFCTFVEAQRTKW
jgi:hypothetical protein